MIRLEHHKFPQLNLNSEKFLNPKKLVIPLTQNIGKPSREVVKVKDEIEEGMLLAEGGGFVSSTIHAPKSGQVVALDKDAHPVLKRDRCVNVRCKNEIKTYPFRGGIERLTKEELLAIIKNSGIVGMGGACFPTHIKLSPPKKVDTLLINGCECEPYLTSDNRLMIEKTDGIFKGVEVAARILEPRKVIFCIEEHNLEAIKKFNRFISTKKYKVPFPTLLVLKSFYPQGGEKQLIHRATKKKVPTGKIPFEVGCLVQNVATCFAIYEAVYLAKPLIERMVTFAGDSLKNPKNIWIRVGTLVSELFEQKILEFDKKPRKIIFGGPMMGVSLDSMEYPILKGTGGVLFLSKSAVDDEDERECIKCGRCVDTCPMNLLPLEYARRVRRNQFDRLNEVFINDCIECGSCEYGCPAKIPIVHYIKRGKAYVSGA